MRCIASSRRLWLDSSSARSSWHRLRLRGSLEQPQLSTSQVTRLEVSRDTWVSEVGQEADGNNGGARG